ncbi:MAG: DUF1295 domain-containing protein [Bacteroidales bacterium]|jgi:3-oxo-5-alpha-steroid 4-dehydrogenase 1|nr:DUF1295 domain-containing protein [Bacteroidales bacterium]
MEQWTVVYDYLLIIMSGLALIVFVVLQFITPPYGMTFNPRWGVSVNSRWGWILMETPVFIAMCVLYVCSLYYKIKPFNITTFTIFVFFQLHYFQRAFIFPLMMKGQSKMPVSVIMIGIIFNTCNAVMQGGWLFYFSPANYYPIEWLHSARFLIGAVLFFTGMSINMHADRIIRQLRKSKTDSNYYLPCRGLFRYVNSANYFGELLEWSGFAVLLWAVPGWVFVFWTFANIVPRSKAVYERYAHFFGEEFISQKRYKILPFIY